MSEGPVIQPTRKLRDAAHLCNERIPLGKFTLLLTRIIHRLHKRDQRSFTQDEEAQLQAMFGLSEAEMHTVIEACCYVLEQAAYSGLRPGVFKDALGRVGFDEDHADAAASRWETEASGFLAKLRERSLGGPKILDGVDWHLQLVMGESQLREAKDATTLLDMTLARPEVLTDRQEETFTMEFSHEQLYKLFLDLEKIQAQLDHLS